MWILVLNNAQSLLCDNLSFVIHNAHKIALFLFLSCSKDVFEVQYSKNIQYQVYIIFPQMFLLHLKIEITLNPALIN